VGQGPRQAPRDRQPRDRGGDRDGELPHNSSNAQVQTASKEDVDVAVKAARAAFETTWGLECSGQERGRLLFALADEMEKRIEDLIALEIVDAGKPVAWARADMEDSIACLRYYAGAADKIQGQAIEMDDKHKYAIARKEPIG
jgi:aldehyde dehydrogenase (NAD+)